MTMTLTSPSATTMDLPAFATDQFRAVCGSFVTGVTVVTASSADGSHGSTVNSFASLSVTPPRIIICLAKTTSTLRHVLASGRFSVNILSDEQESVARVFASRQADKLSSVAWTTGMNGSPVLDDAMATLECSVVEAQEQETHILIVGQVTRAEHDSSASPLVFFRSTMLGGEALTAPTQ